MFSRCRNWRPKNPILPEFRGAARVAQTNPAFVLGCVGVCGQAMTLTRVCRCLARVCARASVCTQMCFEVQASPLPTLASLQ